jgi:hypothetical protein
MKLNSTKLRNVTSTILGGALRLGKLACRIPFLRAIPQLRPMDYACPIIEELPDRSAPSARPSGRKRRRLSVRSTKNPQR